MIAPKLTFWDKVLSLFGTETTWEWCVIGCTIGRHCWRVELSKCRNGTPIGSGYFLTYIKADTEDTAREIASEFKKTAEEFNRSHGYA